MDFKKGNIVLTSINSEMKLIILDSTYTESCSFMGIKNDSEWMGIDMNTGYCRAWLNENNMILVGEGSVELLEHMKTWKIK